MSDGRRAPEHAAVRIRIALAHTPLPPRRRASLASDMWARVYLQQNNEPISVIQNNHVWISDGPDAIIYALEANYGALRVLWSVSLRQVACMAAIRRRALVVRGPCLVSRPRPHLPTPVTAACCTSNFNFGWPRFIQKMIHVAPDGGAAISMLGPATATFPTGATLSVDTEYPFGDTLTITMTNRPAGMPLYVRIPKWATAATVAVNGGAPTPVGAAAANTMFAVPLGGATGPTLTVVLDTAPAIRVDRWYNGAVAVHRGALVYALQLSEVFGVLRNNGLGSRGACGVWSAEIGRRCARSGDGASVAWAGMGRAAANK